MQFLYRLAYVTQRVYWFVVRPTTRGVKCVIFHDGNALMIRSSYGHRRWTFPGDRVGRSENPETAAQREAFEEVGISLRSLEFLGTYSTDRNFKHDTVNCYAATIADDAHHVDGREVADAAWFPLSALPADRSETVGLVVSLLARAHK